MSSDGAGGGGDPAGAESVGVGFIGLGVNPPTPSWGAMISDGSHSISSYPNQAIFPAIALFLIMFAFNFLGDGLRDAADPYR